MLTDLNSTKASRMNILKNLTMAPLAHNAILNNELSECERYPNDIFLEDIGFFPTFIDVWYGWDSWEKYEYIERMMYYVNMSNDSSVSLDRDSLIDVVWNIWTEVKTLIYITEYIKKVLPMSELDIHAETLIDIKSTMHFIEEIAPLGLIDNRHNVIINVDFIRKNHHLTLHGLLTTYGKVD